MLNLAANLSRSAAVLPDHVAIRFGDRQWTYAEFERLASRIANGLHARGIRRGDKVALACPNLPYFPFAYFGILKLGAVVVPINVLLKGAEIAYHLTDSGARALLCFEGTPELPLGQAGWDGFREAGSCGLFIVITADPAAASPIEGVETLGALMHGQSEQAAIANTAADDTAVILYTSGTTGRPKGAELTHGNVLCNAQAVQAITKSDSRDTHLIALPLFHSFGQVVQINCAVLSGASMVLLARFDPDATLAAMAAHAVTIFGGVPTMYIGLLQVPDAETRHDLKKIAANLRIGISGGAAIPVEVLRRFEARFEVPILEGYGLSETSPVATFNQLDFPRIPGSVGQPLGGVEVRVVDANDQPLPDGEVGEVVIRGHNVMKGYLNRPEATAEAIRDGWFHSGDLGRRDARGNFYIVDRIKDMVIRGGFNVYPRELEEVLMTHEAIAQVAVLGVPDAVLGEEVKAVVVLRAGASCTSAALVEWCRERMAAYKYPRLIEIVAAMPMTATGKILKRAMRG
jgi:long-chain acyl-CoA synthetase